MTIKTRFAPSPTGFLHIGGARTALFNYLYTKKRGGSFLLRVEDTDLERSTDESTQAILDGMNWLGLAHDEGPFFQSERFDLYREQAEKLLSDGKAYRCFCTPDELKERREKAMAEGRAPKYDGRCRAAASGDGMSAVRFLIEPGKSVFKDLVKGSIAIDHAEIEDFVILRSDLTPTYNLCVVVDDALMGIDPVIRGDDHINNTPKQILLYEALGFAVPEFAHVPMILGADKSRLSKRHGATSVMAYKDMGYLPEALVNYLARLGWSSGDEEIFSLDELIEKFSLDNVGKSSGVFNPEKLLWLNQHYIKESTNERLAALLSEQLLALGIDAPVDERTAFIAGTLKERAKTLVEMAEGARFFFEEVREYDEKAAGKFLTLEKQLILSSLTEKLEALTSFDVDVIEGVFTTVMEETELKLGKIAQPVRVALTGGTISPGIFETISALGKDKTLLRLCKAIDFIKKATP